MYKLFVFIVNTIMCFVGYFVNAFAVIFIFGDPGGFWGGGALGEILFGLIMFLIVSLINIIVNMKIYRHWNPDASYKNSEFIIPICAYVFLIYLSHCTNVLFGDNTLRQSIKTLFFLSWIYDKKAPLR